MRQPVRRAPPARMAARSSSLRPPHTPYGSRTRSDCSRHCIITGHEWQIAFAASARRRRVEPRSPSGWKNNVSSASRHEPWYCHSHSSMTGPGSLEISAMPNNLQALQDLFKSPVRKK
ncbi:Uncharacterised protein [Mycobacteroides abscessus]|nr:Uncharacterised protein [Mycobacteroides abscessus]